MITPWNNEEEGAKPDAVGQMMRKRAAVLGRKNDRIIIVVDFIGLDIIIGIGHQFNQNHNINMGAKKCQPASNTNTKQAAAVGSRGDARTYQYVP